MKKMKKTQSSRSCVDLFFPLRDGKIISSEIILSKTKKHVTCFLLLKKTPSTTQHQLNVWRISRTSQWKSFSFFQLQQSSNVKPTIQAVDCPLVIVDCTPGKTEHGQWFSLIDWVICRFHPTFYKTIIPGPSKSWKYLVILGIDSLSAQNGGNQIKTPNFTKTHRNSLWWVCGCVHMHLSAKITSAHAFLGWIKL